MDKSAYEKTLREAIARPIYTSPTEPPTMDETDIVLTLVGSIRGLGAKGQLVGRDANGMRVTAFTRSEARKMLEKLNASGHARTTDRNAPLFLPPPRP